MMNKEKKTIHQISSSYKDVGPYLGLGTQLAATIVLMFFAGRWMDNKLETSPLFVIGLSFLGGFAGIYNFIKTVLKLNEKKRIEK
jgi:ATP synthase protein I